MAVRSENSTNPKSTAPVKMSNAEIAKQLLANADAATSNYQKYLSTNGFGYNANTMATNRAGERDSSPVALQKAPVTPTSTSTTGAVGRGEYTASKQDLANIKAQNISTTPAPAPVASTQTIATKPTPIAKPTPIVKPTPTPKPIIIPAAQLTGSGDGSGDSNLNAPTTNLSILKSLLKGQGLPSTLIDSSASFLQKLLNDRLDYDNAISVFLDSKDYTFKDGTKVTSPFYTAYGYLNEGIINPKTSGELYGLVEGIKGVKEKYNLSDKYTNPESLKLYVKNNIRVTDLDERANMARLKAISADPSYTSALTKLGFISSPEDLTDFFLDPKIGQEVLMQNRNTGAFAAEAIRRANKGIAFNKEAMTKISANLTAQGLSEGQISATASEGYENIGQTLLPMTGLSNVYEGAGAASEATIQRELESEQFLGTASERRKKLKELGTRSFQGSAGRMNTKTSTSGLY